MLKTIKNMDNNQDSNDFSCLISRIGELESSPNSIVTQLVNVMSLS